MTDLGFDEDEVSRRQTLLAERLDAVQQRMFAVGGEHVSLLPVSKGHPVEAAIAARRLGLLQLGENYAQDLVAKRRSLLPPPVLSAGTSLDSCRATRFG